MPMTLGSASASCLTKERVSNHKFRFPNHKCVTTVKNPRCIIVSNDAYCVGLLLCYSVRTVITGSLRRSRLIFLRVCCRSMLLCSMQQLGVNPVPADVIGDLNGFLRNRVGPI